MVYDLQNNIKTVRFKRLRRQMKTETNLIQNYLPDLKAKNVVTETI